MSVYERIFKYMSDNDVGYESYFFSRACISVFKRVASGMKQFISSARVEAVSYTHLDVYKRQQLVLM